MTRTITAYFGNRSEAQRASERLMQEGVPSTSISIHDSSSTSSSTTGTEEKGFWASLGDIFMPDEDRYTYSEGIRRGGSVLTVEADEHEFDTLSDILEESGSVDLDSAEASWRSEGWSGYDAGTEGMGVGGMTGGGMAGGRSMTDADTDREGYIPVAREELRIGKREVDHGRVRIRSYVVETPVEEHVSLREETVNVERNPVDRAATSSDNLFQERTIEAESYGEEAVVSKEARVVEEVRMTKDVRERDEVVSDSVRSTEVEVEDERTSQDLGQDERARRQRDL